MHALLAGLIAAVFLIETAAAQEPVLVPERRLALTRDVDFYGADIGTHFDTTLEACEAICLADGRCRAYTFNSRSNACFPKSEVTSEQPYIGAISGRVLSAAPGATARASQRAAELDFLMGEDLAEALEQALSLGRTHVAGGLSAAEHLAAAASEVASGNRLAAARFRGAALSLSDVPEQWTDYARALLEMPNGSFDGIGRLKERALAASVNAYLRAGGEGARVSALEVMAGALEALGRGRETIAALRLAQRLQPRDDLSAALDKAIGKYGFRITEHVVESDSAAPRLCAIFNEPLAGGGRDYAPFVQLPEQGLSVETLDDRICVAGVSHGKRYALTFREGLPSAAGEAMARDVTLNLYVRDRSPAVRFPGRAYVLPRRDQAPAVPVETVNLTDLELTLMRVSDRNLVRAIQNDQFARPLDYWQADFFGSEVAETVWTGTGEVASESNRDVTTLLPLGAELAELGPGIYVLSAKAPGQDVYERPAATQWFVVSDLGLTSISGTDGLHLFVRGLSDAGPRPGLRASLISRANAVLAVAVTDAEGYAHFPAGLTEGKGGASPGLLTVETPTAEEGDLPQDYAFLSLSETEFDLTDRGVAGRQPAPPIDVFLASERGAYRAGETIGLTALVRDGKAGAIEGLPLTIRLLRPDGVEYSRRLSDAGRAGGHVIGLPLAASAPRGTWRIEALADPKAPALASIEVLVEDFLPERIDFTLSLPDAPLALGAVPELSIAARYLFGAPGAGLRAEGELRLAATSTVAGYEGYRFGRHDEPFWPMTEPLEMAETDAGGAALLPVPLPMAEGADRPLLASVILRMAEGSGRPVERRIERVILPADTPVAGILPLFEEAAPEGGEARFRLVALGADLAPAAVPLRWVLNRIERRYQWYSLYGAWNWDVTTSRTRVAEGRTAPADQPQEIALPVAWGEYELLVEPETGGAGGMGAASTLFHAGWYAPADAAATPDRLEMSLDKPAYRSGETARLRLVPEAAGVALVSVLSNRLIAMRAVPVVAGENLIDLPVTDEWGAGAYVTVSALRPMQDGAPGGEAETRRVPVRALGIAHAGVDPGPRRLVVAIEAAVEADPRGPMPVAVRVEGVGPGETAYVSLAAVDLGILNLTAHAAPDPEAHYFGQRRLGMAIRDLYGRLIDGEAGAPGLVRSGGDGAAGMKLKAPPPTEELVAFFEGPLTVGADGYARAEFALPAFNGTVRLTAVAWSRSSIGQAGAEVLVRDPVVLTASVPRFLAPGDESRLLLEITHAAGPAGRVKLEIGSDRFVLPKEAPASFDLAEGGTARFSLPFRAPDTVGDGTIRITLTAPGGKRLSRDLAIPVALGDPQVARTSRFDLAPGKTFTLDDAVFTGMIPGSGRAVLALGPIARFDAPGLLAALDAYPYGCTEQITSKALPLLYFGETAVALGLGGAGDIGRRIDEAIAAVLLNQSAGGGFGLWRPDSGDLWLDAYVTDFLSRARTAGHPVPDTAFRNALDNLRNQVNYAPDFDHGGGDLAYALMVLAREGAAATGDLRYFADVKAEAFSTPIALAQLGSALAAYGDQTRADALFARAAARLASSPDAGATAPVWRADYGSPLRDAAAVLALAAEAGSSVASDPGLGERVASGIVGRQASTQEATWALLATHALIDRPGTEGFTIDGQPASGPLVRFREAAALAAPVAVANGSASAAVLTLTTFGVPEVAEPAGGRGYAITRRYYTLEGEPADPSALAQGSRLVAVLEVRPLAGGAARLIVDDPLPAGFEIDNPSLIRSGDIAALNWLETTADTRMTEFRQDRFLAALDWTEPGPFRLAYIVRAISPGRFRHPAASVEDMYRPEFRAWTDTGRVEVTE